MCSFVKVPPGAFEMFLQNHKLFGKRWTWFESRGVVLVFAPKKKICGALKVISQLYKVFNRRSHHVMKITAQICLVNANLISKLGDGYLALKYKRIKGFREFRQIIHKIDLFLQFILSHLRNFLLRVTSMGEYNRGTLQARKKK